jgi:hypothetical protein
VQSQGASDNTRPTWQFNKVTIGVMIMHLSVITYSLGPDAHPRELLLDVHAKRWSERKMLRTIIAYEFPSAALPGMKFRQWSADEVLRHFGICNYECSYRYAPGFQGNTNTSGIVLELKKGS